MEAIAPNWNQKNDLGQSGLYLACANGHLAVVRILLDQGADINLSGGRLGTPLQAACYEGHANIVQLLVENGADTKSKGLFQNSLQASMKGNREEVAVLLLTQAFTIDKQSEYDQILEEASQTGLVKVVDHVQKAYGSLFGDRGSSERKAIQAAISKGQIGVLQRFIQKITDPQVELPADAVAIAASGGHGDMITLLLNYGLDIESESQFGSPLRSASLFGHESTVELLLSRAAKPDANGSKGNALEAAAMNGHVLIVNSLLQEGINVNIMAGSYGTALQAASFRGYLKVAKILLDAGASPYLSGMSKDAFHAAVEGGHETIVRILLEYGYILGRERELPCPSCLCSSDGILTYGLLHSSSPSRLTQSGSSLQEWYYDRDYALEKAASKRNLSIMRMILDGLSDKGAQPISAYEIKLSIYEASRKGHEEVVECLLNSDLNLAPYLNGAFKAAVMRGRFKVANVLFSHHQFRLYRRRD
ncbi:MAG: hypothetical protein Q9170_004570 [Blastenia crenularia]